MKASAQSQEIHRGGAAGGRDQSGIGPRGIQSPRAHPSTPTRLVDAVAARRSAGSGIFGGREDDASANQGLNAWETPSARTLAPRRAGRLEADSERSIIAMIELFQPLYAICDVSRGHPQGHLAEALSAANLWAVPGGTARKSTSTPGSFCARRTSRRGSRRRRGASQPY